MGRKLNGLIIIGLLATGGALLKIGADKDNFNEKYNMVVPGRYWDNKEKVWRVYQDSFPFTFWGLVSGGIGIGEMGYHLRKKADKRYFKSINLKN